MRNRLSNFAEKYIIDGKPKIYPDFYFSEKIPQLIELLRNHRNIKVRMILVCLMEVEKPGSILSNGFCFHSKTFLYVESTDVGVILFQMIKHIKNSIIELTSQDSCWYFKELIRLEVHTVDYKPMKGESYIPLSDFIMRKKAIINMENKDDKFFLWSVLRYLHPVQKNVSRINDLREYENDLNFKGINFPVKLKDIQKFENQNSDLPGINVFSINDNNKIYPLRLSQKDTKKTIDLFLFSKEETKHYSLIKNFSRLKRSQITSNNKKIHICKKCLTHFTKQNLLERHSKYCSQNETAFVKMPTKNTILNFQNHFKKLPIPFVIYADFECFIIPMNSCQPNPDKSFTEFYQKHEASGYALYLKGLEGINVNYKPLVYTKKTEDEDISKNLSNMF